MQPQAFAEAVNWLAWNDEPAILDVEAIAARPATRLLAQVTRPSLSGGNTFWMPAEVAEAVVRERLRLREDSETFADFADGWIDADGNPIPAGSEVH